MGALTCFGIPPESPHTGYGYIECSSVPATENAVWSSRFIEKPNQAQAQSLLDQGNVLWNSGIFLFDASTYLAALAQRQPQLLASVRAAIDAAQHDLDFVRLAASPYQAMTGISIDHAVMETADRVCVVPVRMGWSDVGSWSALHDRSQQDADGNTILGDVVDLDCRNSYLRSEQPLVVTIGLTDTIVIASHDAVLVASKAHDQQVKQAVDRLIADKRRQATHSVRTWRPWGWYQTLDAGAGFLVKHVMVKAGASLSLQMHRYRSEHWVIVDGSAEVTRGEEILVMQKNESVFIPAGQKHRLRNLGPEPLRLIEVQSGSYCGEDDIVRLSDQYGRVPPE